MILKKVILVLLSVHFINFLFAQDAPKVLWASEVVAFSSQENSKSPQFKASQVLGKPNKLPAGGSSPCAWQPESEDNPNGEWIKVRFDEAINIKQVAVGENFNPGSVSQIYLYDEEDKEYAAIYNNMNVSNLGSGARMFSVFVPLTEYKVKAVKIVLSTFKVKGFNQIDCIAISDSDEPVKAEINVIANDSDFEINSKPENLGTNVNSEFQEVSPIIAPDGKTIYFTRAKHPRNMGDVPSKEKKQDVWYATINEDGSFNEAVNIGKPINTDQNNSSFSITPDGNEMLLNNSYKEDGSLTKGLSITTRTKEGNWSFPKDLVIEGYYNKNKYSEFCLSASKQYLLMTTERDDSYGDKDIYVSFAQPGTNLWSIPLNLGAIVNTISGETSPFLASDEKTLYYSTAGLSGYGYNDIFVTKRLDDTWQNWSTPQNLGPSINTPMWDAYFTIDASGKYAYYASYYNTLGDCDVFRVKLSEKSKPDPVALIQGQVLNAHTNEPVAAQIIYEILPESSKAGEALSNGQDGNYKVILGLGKLYGIRAEVKGYFPVEENLDLSELKDYQEITKNLYLTPIQKGEVFRLDHIYFVRAKAKLLPESNAELDRLVNILNENASLVIELDGHTEPFGDPKELKELSKNRVLAVRKYLLEQGVNEAQIKYKAFGGTLPLNRESDEASRAQNRRVEVKVLKYKAN